MAHPSIIVKIEGAEPELLAKGQKAAEDFFRSVGVDPRAAAAAQFKLSSFEDVGEWLYEISDEEHEAADAWRQAPHVVMEACQVDNAEIELVLEKATS